MRTIVYNATESVGKRANALNYARVEYLELKQAFFAFKRVFLAKTTLNALKRAYSC